MKFNSCQRRISLPDFTKQAQQTDQMFGNRFKVSQTPLWTCSIQRWWNSFLNSRINRFCVCNIYTCTYTFIRSTVCCLIVRPHNISRVLFRYCIVSDNLLSETSCRWTCIASPQPLTPSNGQAPVPTKKLYFTKTTTTSSKIAFIRKVPPSSTNR